MSAAKLVRSIADNLFMGESRGGEPALLAYHRDLPDGDLDEAMHTAADALEALAVGRLPSILDRMWGIGGVYGLDLTAEERAALATLAKIASESK